MVKRFLWVEVFPMTGRFPTDPALVFPTWIRHFRSEALALWKDTPPRRLS
jgi:hypothetical protein